MGTRVRGHTIVVHGVQYVCILDKVKRNTENIFLTSEKKIVWSNSKTEIAENQDELSKKDHTAYAVWLNTIKIVLIVFFPVIRWLC